MAHEAAGDPGQRRIVRRDAHLAQLLGARLDRLRALGRVGLKDVLRKRHIVGKAEIEQLLAGVIKQGADVVHLGVALGFAVLRHDIHDVELHGVGSGDRGGDAVRDQVRHDARVEAAGADDDKVRLLDRLQHGRHGGGTLRQQLHAADPLIGVLLDAGDLGLSDHGGAVVKLRHQADVLRRHGQDAPRNGKRLAHAAHGLLEAAVNVIERGEHEIAQALSGEAPLAKAVAHELIHRRLHICKRADAVADVARREHAELLAQNARAAAVIRDRDDRGDAGGKALQAAQHGGKARAPADRDDARLGELLQFFHGINSFPDRDWRTARPPPFPEDDPQAPLQRRRCGGVRRCSRRRS